MNELSLRMVDTDLQDIRLLDLDEIISTLEDWGEATFRGRQIWEWLWQKNATSFEEMTTLSLQLRDRLSQHFSILPIRLELKQMSQDGTIKCRFKLHDGHAIESVLIPVEDQHRYTACVSTQVGCSLTCSFCATGKMERIRNLTYPEIVDQVAIVSSLVQEHYQKNLTNIVYMGMGEPLLNYQNMLASVERLTAPDGRHISPRRITVSTAGIAKMIRKLADDQVRFNLALSLHAATDDKRKEIMPINEQNNLDALRSSLLYFQRNNRGKITFEYIAFADFNDSEKDALALVAFAKGLHVTINIIEYNPVAGVTMVKSEEDQLNKFASVLRDHNLAVTTRRSRGKDIDAACGQLANKD